MTYAGFKSLIYAHLPANDARVQAALGWIRRNYTLAENPGIGNNGMYYYLLTFARALKAAGALAPDPKAAHTLEAEKGDGSKERHDWANDLIDRLAELQSEDGSFKSLDKRWMEDNPVLITAYALLALGNTR
jgi:squalene-hopene/tetraprenyl-beta-curcumene cyclase